MLIVYDTLTGNVGRFINKLDYPSIRIQDGLMVGEPYILVTYTTGLGLVPDSTKKFLESNGSNLRGVATSGNRNFGKYYGLAADAIADEYGVPIIHKFEFAGLPSDRERFKKGVEEREAHRIK
ncbi:MAG: class Ib ribonucleoside-diphosphate reductase assembly flavoprotein NrdI [Turicibacter sp.]|nr:class Ib ribonucleoside-diphosphate reductase assembly flavoprotein NrdI [Turicibacter sp.]